MSERIGTLKNYIKGPRWANVPEFIKNLCFVNDLELEIDVDKGIIRETVRFKITGPESKLLQVGRCIERSINDYNH